MSRKSTVLAAMIGLAAGLVSNAVQAGTNLISVDINNPSNIQDFSGSAGTGTATDQWNYFDTGGPNSASLTNLKETDGTARTVSVTVTDTTAFGGNDVSGFNGNTANALLNDYFTIQPDGGPMLFTISNLKPNTSYSLYLYSSIGGNSYPGAFAIDNQTGGLGNAQSDTGGGGPFVQNTNYVLFSGISSDSSGVISGNMTSPIDYFAAFNGFQIQGDFSLSAPEPASLSLLTIVAAPLLLRRRRA